MARAPIEQRADLIEVCIDCGHWQGFHGAPQIGRTLCLDPDFPECECQEYRDAAVIGQGRTSQPALAD